jgi:transposase-like protein
MATLAEIRAQYPQYNDMSDSALADAMYQKHYSDIPRDEFNRRIGFAQPTTADAVTDGGSQLVRGINRGINAVVSLPGEIFGGAVNMVAPGQGDRFKWNNVASEFMTSPNAKPTTTLGRYADSVGQAIGSSAIPMAGIAAKSMQAAPAAQTTIGAVGQQIVNAYRASPGAAVAGDVVASVGGGIGQQAAQEGGFGATGQMIGGLAGAMAPAGIAAGVGGAVRQVQRARANMGEQGAYGRIAESVDGPLTDLVDNVATGGTNMSAAINRRTIDVLGEEMTRAGGDVARAQQATIARLANEFGVPPTTAADQIRRLTSVHRDSPLMLGEYPSVARSNAETRSTRPQNVNLDDVARTQESQTQYKLDTLGNNGNAPSAATVRNAVNQREEGLGPALGEMFVRSGPRVAGRPASIADVENMIGQADQLASAEYRAAHNGPVNNGLMMNWLPRLLEWHTRRATSRSGDIERAINNAVDQFYTNTPNGRIAMSSLQQLQDARGVLRGQITQYRTQGRNDLVNAVQPVYDHVTRLMAAMSPQWAQANRRWADGRLNEVASELGDAFAKQAGPRFREQMRAFNQMAPEAQNVVRVHWIQQQLDKLTNLPDTHSVAKAYTNDHMRNMVRSLLGDQAAVDFTRLVRDIKVAEQSKGMMRNSATHRRGQAQKQEDLETGLVSAVDNVSAKGMLQSFLERSAQVLTEQRNRPMAKILTTPMNDTARVAMHLHRMQQQKNRLAQFAQPRVAPPAAVGRFAPMLNPMLEDSNAPRVPLRVLVNGRDD